ncbi:hypothetical protein HPB47_010057 [Ixodes persulcatus]|uniref:Uncharacterized protein n=1 Tax=Ixodes persulcatus TaxID=34615 RepID=A0AC60P053_IXOPE|nr:hypothetical protein HPB47_010057 [Ixodes persulcatus]
MLKRSSRCQPMPPPVGMPPDPDTVSEPEATTEADSSNWDSFTTLVHTAAQATPTKCTSTVVIGDNLCTLTAPSTEREWRRRCGFLGFQSLKDSEQALQDLCGVTMTVFSLLLDKGFPSIRTTVAEKGAVLVMPPFSSAGQQFSQEGMDNTYHIAQVRIHVERSFTVGPTDHSLGRNVLQTVFLCEVKVARLPPRDRSHQPVRL